ncbi:MAG: PEP-CTERM system TPR-repeat protein PrsT [Gammaproteobacteria bacterium]|nr:PEP-CTERM system TPR-repeat protein PrsT [Gammaproteobacteria bacterium]
MVSSFGNITKLIVLTFLVGTLFSCAEKVLTEQEYIESAKVSTDKGDYREATIFLKNALAHYPNSAEARYLLGDIYTRIGMGGGAEKELRRAAELGVSPEAIVSRLGDAMLMQGRAHEALAYMELSDRDSELLRGGKLVARGDAYFQLKDIKQAEAAYKSAANISAVKTRANLGLARVSLINKRNEEAIEIVEESIRENANDVLAWLTRADVYRSVKDSAQVIASYEKAASLSTSLQDYYYFVAVKGQIEQYLEENSTEKSENLLNSLRDTFHKRSFPDRSDLNQIRSVLAFQKKEYSKSKDLAEKVVKADSGHQGAILILGAINTIEGNFEQAEDHLQRFLSLVPGNQIAREMLAFTQLSRNEANAAVETLKPLEKRKELTPKTLALIASASLSAGDAERGVAYFRKALQQVPEDKKIRGGLAQSLVGMGEYDQAIAEFTRMSDGADDISANLAIVQTHIKAKNYVNAINELKRLEALDKNSPLLVSMQGTVHLLSGNEGAARDAFLRAFELTPGYPPAGRNLAALEVKKGDFGQAEVYFEAVLKENPDHVTTLYDFAQFQMRQRKFDGAAEMIKKAQKKDSDEISGAVLLARIYLQQQKASQALAELRNIKRQVGKNSAVLAEMGNAQMMLGEYTNALESYRSLARLEEESALAHYLVYTAYFALNNKAEAVKALDRSLDRGPNFVPAVIAKVNIYFAEKNYRMASQWIDKLQKAGTTNHVAERLLRAQLAMFENKPKIAVEIYEELAKQNIDADVVQKLAQAYWSMGKKTEAMNVLDDAKRKNPEDAQLQYVLATAYDAMGEKNRAIGAYKKAVELNGEHVLALNNLAWLLKDTDSKLALSYAEKATELAPNNKAILDTLETIKAK